MSHKGRAMFRDIEYFAKLLGVTQGYSKWHRAVQDQNREADSHIAYQRTCTDVIVVSQVRLIDPLIATLKQQSNGPSYSNTVIGTLAVEGWAVTFGTARRGLGGAAARPGPSSLY